MFYSQKIVFGLEQILQWPTSKYPKIITFFVIGSICLLSTRKCQVEITEFKPGGFGMILFFACMI